MKIGKGYVLCAVICTGDGGFQLRSDRSDTQYPAAGGKDAPILGPLGARMEDHRGLACLFQPGDGIAGLVVACSRPEMGYPFW